MSRKHHSKEYDIKNTLKEKHSEAINKKCEEKECNKEDKVEIQTCSEVTISEILPVCESIPKVPSVIEGQAVIKVPVVIAEPCITIPIISSITIKENNCEIKRIRKNVYLNQCKLIPNSENDNPDYGMLFISGFIRKNIEYTVKERVNKNESSGKLKHSTFEVDFNCTANIKYITKPRFTRIISQDEVEILENQNKFFEPCKGINADTNTYEQSFRLYEFFNEKVFCELVSAEIIETDILEDSAHDNSIPSMQHNFCNINEKVVLYLTLKLLQNQQIKIQ